MDSPGPLYYLAIFILLVCSALFSASETAISSVSRVRLKKLAEKGVKRAKTALAIAENYDKALYSILIGNNIVNIASVSLATVILIFFFGRFGALWATLIMTALILIFGKILPKSYGKNQNERLILGISGFLKLIITLLTPVTWILAKLRNRISPLSEDSPSVTEEDLHYLIETVEEEGVIEEYERDLVKSALEFDDTGIKDILTPRVNMVAIDIEDEPDEIKRVILEEGYSRIPVFEENIDNIIGILFAKDYLRNLVEGRENNVREMLVKPCFVHRMIKVSRLLSFFKVKKTNIAIVTDDYGGTLGLITTEDILEELVGDLWEDEGSGEIEPEEIIRTGENEWEILGSCYLRDLNEAENWQEYDFEGDYSTVNGWALQIFGHIPEVGETAAEDDLLLIALEVDDNRIVRLGVKKRGPENKGGKDNDGDVDATAKSQPQIKNTHI